MFLLIIVKGANHSKNRHRKINQQKDLLANTVVFSCFFQVNFPAINCEEFNSAITPFLIHQEHIN